VENGRVYPSVTPGTGKPLLRSEGRDRKAPTPLAPPPAARPRRAGHGASEASALLGADFFLFPVLQFVKLAVQAILCEELLVRSFLTNLAPVHDQYLMCVLNG
jgi:hypothetical protein